MKVAFLHFWTLRMRRGVETLVISLANALADRGKDVSIITAKQTQLPLVSPSSQVRVHQFPTFRYYEFATIAPFYAADLIREQYDSVIVFFADFGEGRALQLAAPFAHPRLFLYLTFPYESAPHRYHAYQYWNWNERATNIFADAAYTAKRGEEILGRSVAVLPSGTDPHCFKPCLEKRNKLRQRLGFGEHDIVLLNVAALEDRKGIWRVIEALPAVRDRFPQIRYLILGEGRTREKLERRVTELGLNGNIIFAGTTTDLPAFYNAADIFVMLPDSEAGSVACLEAMASGLPVVVSNTGGFAEAVNVQSGRMVNIHDQTEIANTLIELAYDEMLCAQMGKAGRATIVEKFSWEQLAARLDQLCSN